jgi:adenosylcobyric acid synthase
MVGTYVHGLFHNAAIRHCILRQVAARKGASLPLKQNGFTQSQEYDKLADLLRQSLRMEAVYRITGLARG